MYTYIYCLFVYACIIRIAKQPRTACAVALPKALLEMRWRIGAIGEIDANVSFAAAVRPWPAETQPRPPHGSNDSTVPASQFALAAALSLPHRRHLFVA